MDSTLINYWLQSLGDWLFFPMRVFTFMGYQQFYLLFLSIVYWCVSPRLGARLAVGLMFSAVSNGILKLAFHSPRPYWVDARIKPLGVESSFGMPSGHAQNGIVFWGLLADGLRVPALTVVFILITVLIGISRLYLGVHFLGDVLAGWVIGFICLILMVRLEKPFLAWFNRKSAFQQVFFLLAASLGFLAAAEAVRSSLGGFAIPAEWLSLASRNANSNQIDPFSTREFIDGAGAFFGISAGFIQMSKRGWFDPAGSGWKRIFRSLFGLAGAFLIWIGLGVVLPDGSGWGAGILRYLRYALLGYWVACLGPLLFIRFKLLAPIHTQSKNTPR